MCAECNFYVHAKNCSSWLDEKQKDEIDDDDDNNEMEKDDDEKEESN